MEGNLLVFKEMLAYYSGDPKSIQHFLKVEAFCEMIAEGQQIDNTTALVVSILGYVHDIGIKLAEQKFHSSAGIYQEKLGEEPARTLIVRLGFDKDIANRVAYVVRHHHTYINIDNIEYQILVEADFLVNSFENNLKTEDIISFRDKVFKTTTGIFLINQMYGFNN